MSIHTDTKCDDNAVNGFFFRRIGKIEKSEKCEEVFGKVNKSLAASERLAKFYSRIRFHESDPSSLEVWSVYSFADRMVQDGVEDRIVAKRDLL